MGSGAGFGGLGSSPRLIRSMTMAASRRRSSTVSVPVRPRVTRFRKETGLHDVRVHDLRHSYASRALALGEGLPAIGRLLSHVRVGTTAKYAHLVRDAEKAAAARTGDSIGAQILLGRAEAA